MSALLSYALTYILSATYKYPYSPFNIHISPFEVSTFWTLSYPHCISCALATRCYLYFCTFISLEEWKKRDTLMESIIPVSI